MFKKDKTYVFALGGLGEVGKNMYCIMHNDEIIIIDAGVIFPEEELRGIDNVLPDFTFFQRTYEFDIFKYVSRGLIKSQQNYENQLNDLKLQNLKTKKQILSLKKEIELLKGNNPNYNSTENNNLKIQEITNEENIEEKEVESSNESMVKMTNAFHDRFMVLDDKTVYHIGASIKDAGKKCFGITLIQDDTMANDLISRLKKIK